MTLSNEQQKLVIHVGGMPYTMDEASLLAKKEFRQKRFRAAADICHLIIEKVPDHAETFNNRGCALQQLEQYDEALASYNKAIAIKSNYAEAYNNKGLTLQQLKRYEDALENFRKALAFKPDYVAAYYNQSAVLRSLRRYEEALASCDKAMTFKSDHIANYNRAIALQQLKRYDDALESYNKAIDLRPDYAEAYLNRGLTLYTLKKYGEALESYDKAIAIRPNYAEAYNNRGRTMQQLRRYDDAVEDYRKAIELKPDYLTAYHNHGAILRRMMKFDETLANCDKAITRNPNHAPAWNNRGDILVGMGKMQEAEQMFLKALELKPDMPAPLFSLTVIRKYKDPDHADSTQIQMLLNKPHLSQHDRGLLYFALGKIYDDCGLYDEAFESYRHANEICNANVTNNPDQLIAFTNNVINVFSKKFLAQTFPFASDNQSPLFILGMPRSGTTLLASMLSNHPAIATAGELPTMIDSTTYMSGMIGTSALFPQVIKEITPDVAFQLISDYEKRLRRDVGPEIPYVIDKHPFNYKLLGLIAMLFPKAKIIHCTRHPLDTCLSNYFQRFALEYNYAFDLENIAYYYKEYLRFMEHWRKVVPMPMIDISYEDTITNTEQTARKVLDFLGLEWDERCIAPHTNPCVVETASKWQVRQPIYKQSLERWRHYEKHLQPLKDCFIKNSIPY